MNNVLLCAFASFYHHNIYNLIPNHVQYILFYILLLTFCFFTYSSLHRLCISFSRELYTRKKGIDESNLMHILIYIFSYLWNLKLCTIYSSLLQKKKGFYCFRCIGVIAAKVLDRLHTSIALRMNKWIDTKGRNLFYCISQHYLLLIWVLTSRV